MLAAAALLLVAQAAPAAAEPLPPVDAALAIERSLVCRRAPFAIEEARAYLAAQGWPDVTRPPMTSAGNTSYQFERDRIWLVIHPFNASLATCQTNARIAETTNWPDLLARVTVAFGSPPDTTGNNRAQWHNVGGRKIEVSLIERRWFNIVYQPANAEPTPDPTALTAASSAPSATADEIAAAASACMAAVDGRNVDASVLRNGGWRNESERGGVRILSREGSNVRIFAARSQCVVDAYGQRRNSFDAIRDAIQARLTAQFGAQATMGESLGEASSPSRGQGFMVGNRIGVLSSEQRDAGLSIRFTVMSIR
jgi:hypothetical protein